MYDVNTYDHAMCTRFHHPLNMTLITTYQLWFPLIPLVVGIYYHYKNIIFPLFCNFCSTINKLILKKIHIRSLIFDNDFFPITY